MSTSADLLQPCSKKRAARCWHLPEFRSWLIQYVKRGLDELGSNESRFAAQERHSYSCQKNPQTLDMEDAGLGLYRRREDPFRL